MKSDHVDIVVGIHPGTCGHSHHLRLRSNALPTVHVVRHGVVSCISCCISVSIQLNAGIRNKPLIYYSDARLPVLTLDTI